MRCNSSAAVRSAGILPATNPSRVGRCRQGACATMKAAHLLVVMGVTAAVSLAHAAPAPLVARVTDAPGGSVMQAYGEGFEPGKVEVRGLQLHWPGEPKDKEKVSQAALDSARQTGLQAELPAAPPKEAQRCQVIDATAQVVAFVAPRSGQAVTAVWIRNGDSDWSAPFLANLPKPWWIDRETLAPVERATIYGRELSMVYRQPVILLRKDKDVRRAALADQYDVNYHHNSYVVGFLVPADAPQGEHEVWVHNGTGAEHGWAKAGAIRIASSAPSRPPKVIDARKHNAVGDGIADDTPAL
ncbi:MAG: hypothetical protein FJ279_17370, partial [Planctomycetes bacterium]|nr:hypothetical protein [Planctomycetota bacterium]